jgi:hypothetical protein
VSLPEFAISIRQPWAWLIVHGSKDIENRSWPTKFRGRVLVHAAKGMSTREYNAACESAYDSRGFMFWIPPASSLPRGGIVGEVEIVGCVDRSSSEWFMGGFGFVLRNPKALPFIPCRGALGFFQPALPEPTLPNDARARGIRCRCGGYPYCKDPSGWICIACFSR